MNSLVAYDDSGQSDLGLSILDGQYAISIREAVNTIQPFANDAVQAIADFAMKANLAKDSIPKKPAAHYVVDMTAEMEEKIEAGIIKLDYSKDGRIFAQIRGANGRYGKKLPIKRELIKQGVDPQEVRMAVQMMAIQQKLQTIAETMDEISAGVADVIKGQHNDRLGLFYSGVALLLEAREIENEMFRKQVSSQALRALSDATGQLTQEIQEDIRYLVNGEYGKGNKKQRTELIEERMNRINLCFDAIHRASVLKAATYFYEGEPSAFLLAVEEYSRFIDRAIAPYAGKLTEFDKSDMLLADGKWETRARALEGASELRKKLSSETTFYLVPAETVEGEGEDVVA